MKRKMLNAKELMQLGYPSGKASALAINTVMRFFRREEKDEIILMLRDVLSRPKDFLKDAIWEKLAVALTPEEETFRSHELLKNRIAYTAYGLEGIEAGAQNQMEIAMKLPVTLAGALMPDAHQGYGLPIGGVLAIRNAVIPYCVGVNIGCRMSLSAYPLDEKFLERNRDKLAGILNTQTRFGFEVFDRAEDHEVLHRELFDTLPLLRRLKGKAAAQIGSSGSGNHFVEFGLSTINDSNPWNVTPGKYLSVLSHSGSRGMGAEIARHYTKVATACCRLPREAATLAWLDLDSEEGQEYWMAMNLAGDYAEANHHQVHKRIAKALGERPLFTVENHHNFAWKEKLSDGTEAIVHRKGATPAGENVLGIIPGSMTTSGFIVRGLGVAAALSSASHGAGRRMSRSDAKQQITRGMMRKALTIAGVDLTGGGVDESPMAYKDIHEVMRYQQDLVEVLGEFSPKIVRMCGDQSSPED